MTNAFKKATVLESITWFVIMLFYFEPQYFSQIPSLHRFFYFGKLASCLAVLVIVFLHYKSYKMSKMVGICIIAEWWLFFGTALNRSGSIVDYVSHVVSMLCFVLMLDYMLWKNPRKGITVLLLIFELLIYGCLITMIFFPDGLYGTIGASRKYWFLGHVNSNIVYILPGLMMSFLYSYCGNRRKHSLCARTIVLTICCIYMVIAAWSATAVVGLFLAVSIFIASSFEIRVKLFWGVIASFTLWILFGIFRLQDLFEFVLMNILHRNLTFTGRTEIWNNIIDYIIKKPIWGYGVEPNEIVMMKFGVSQAHNKYFHLLYQGGIVLLFLFLLLVYLTAHHLDKHKNTYAVAVVTSCLFAFLLMIVFESYTSDIFFVGFVFAYHIHDIEKLNEIPINKKIVLTKKRKI